MLPVIRRQRMVSWSDEYATAPHEPLVTKSKLANINDSRRRAPYGSVVEYFLR